MKKTVRFIDEGVDSLGREFLDVFTEWAEEYDAFVQGKDKQYKEVFEDYEKILDSIVEKSGRNVMEFGIGTGNLTEKLLNAEKNVFAVEPSRQMRELANGKLPEDFIIYDGDLQQYPIPTHKIDTIVSSYVFHHLTDEEKNSVLKQYNQLLTAGGKVIFADTLFISEKSYKLMIEEAVDMGYAELVEDLNREHYPMLPVVYEALKQAGFLELSFRQMNRFVWVFEGTKK